MAAALGDVITGARQHMRVLAAFPVHVCVCVCVCGLTFILKSNTLESD